MIDNEFILQDRIQKIQSVMRQYGEENFAISFSGGKDSMVMHTLFDMALPGNKIPRVYADTGLDLKIMRDFVHDMAEQDERIAIIKPSVPVIPMLQKDGYPFKSKKHSALVEVYQKSGETQGVHRYLTANDGKWKGHDCPKVLKYQFTPAGLSFKVSDKCCYNMKERPLEMAKRSLGKKFHVIGIMREEGGRRENAECLAFRKDKLRAFQPLAPLTKDWENWFIEEYKVKLCDIYYPPYSFERTGCKGCPFALHLQEELDTLEMYFPGERAQCELIWKPVYEEYRRLKYRLKEPYIHQMSLEEWQKGSLNDVGMGC